MWVRVMNESDRTFENCHTAIALSNYEIAEALLVNGCASISLV